MKNCPACGEPNRDDALFCSACGARFPQQDQGAADPGAAPGPEPWNPNYQAPDPQPGYDGQPNYGGPYHGAGAYPPPVEPRSVAICLILSLVTCGIYMLYWMYKVNDELNLLAGNPNGTSGGMVLVFDILTCGIYGIYWNYKMGQNVSRLTGDNFSPIVMLLLALFQCSFISLALMQDTINKYA